jgi:hypothetical protein
MSLGVSAVAGAFIRRLPVDGHAGQIDEGREFLRLMQRG